MISPVRHDPSQWCLMATLEVAENAPDLPAILADLDFDFRLERIPSPPGFLWFNLLVNARRGQRRCALIAHRLLNALRSIADAGDLPAFRIIAGERWLHSPSADVDDARHSNVEQGRPETIAETALARQDRTRAP
ncbi:hypothetical protein [Dokdonella fugitiva]|uniref:Uncharacterized protein n=1 Tax=Dokdonella fugitiva TaxID=328517 RepID=A0A4R2IBF8_9GAMM|nr:hypothetical protein [Dokdonella fugitiva]TCO40778.1 hypothetical protein EV148_104140 [Dokdonella fugitiva]